MGPARAIRQYRQTDPGLRNGVLALTFERSEA
jgi:hypothetical protein